jgi:hypothetical protein
VDDSRHATLSLLDKAGVAPNVISKWAGTPRPDFQDQLAA